MTFSVPTFTLILTYIFGGFKRVILIHFFPPNDYILVSGAIPKPKFHYYFTLEYHSRFPK